MRDVLGQIRRQPIPDFTAEQQRWPAYVPPAREVQLGSMMGFLLFTDDEDLGALNLYSRRPGAFTECPGPRPPLSCTGAGGPGARHGSVGGQACGKSPTLGSGKGRATSACATMPTTDHADQAVPVDDRQAAAASSANR
ncbi:hypothetical protein [Streptomyces avermitilis]|uniref:hypothetical protein n=1 Tax=Streptomyces avermitilis TaxID=33903 RepID=UPI0037159753